MRSSLSEPVAGHVAVSAIRSRWSWLWVGRWYFVVTLASAGLLAWVPFVHAARRLRRRSDAVWAGAYGIAAAVVGVLLALNPTDAQGDPVAGGQVVSALGGFLMLAVMAGACVQQTSLRREVYFTTPVAPVDTLLVPVGTDPALAAALAARDRRETARALAARDPLIARDLRIGRPDLPRTYDDGGLVDLNSAPAAVIGEICDLTADVAAHIVDTRTACGGYLVLDDVFTMADIPVSTWEVVRDRGVVIHH
jgi:hypothetical protein